MNDAVAAGAAAGAAVALVAFSLGARARAALLSTVMPAADAVSPSARMLRSGWLRLAAASAAAAIVGALVAGPGGGVASGVAAALVPTVRRRRRRAGEAVALEDGLADAVSAMAAAIRAGRSMAGALQEAASTVPPPLGPRLAAIVDRLALGVPVDRALLQLADSVPGSDGRLVVAVLGLHQRTGGDVAVVLDRVARTLRERRASAREVRALTAQARLSGAILGFLPIGFFLFLSVTAREDVARALGSTAGLTAVVMGSIMQAVAFVWIRRLLRVEG
jgi:tight adherence protein B